MLLDIALGWGILIVCLILFSGIVWLADTYEGFIPGTFLLLLFTGLAWLIGGSIRHGWY